MLNVNTSGSPAWRRTSDGGGTGRSSSAQGRRSADFMGITEEEEEEEVEEVDEFSPHLKPGEFIEEEEEKPPPTPPKEPVKG